MPVKLDKPSQLNSNSEKKAMRAIHNVSWSFSRLIRSKLEEAANESIKKVAPILTLDQLYDVFDVQGDERQALLRTERVAGYRYYNTYKLSLLGFGIDGVRVPVSIRALIPRANDTLTGTSELAPVFKFVQEWSMLNYTIYHVLPWLNRTAVSAIFPWIRDMLKETDYDFTPGEKNKNFYRLTMIGNAGDRKMCDACIRAVMGPASNLPITPYLVGEAAASGSKLFTQARLLKNRPQKRMEDEQVQILPELSDEYVPKELKDAVEEMKNFHQELKQQARWSE